MRGSMQGSSGTRGRLGAVFSTLALAALAVPAAASGEPIYVAPEDESSGFFCSESQPCGIAVGINLVAGQPFFAAASVSAGLDDAGLIMMMPFSA